MQATTTIGLDIAKSVFQVHGVDADGRAARRPFQDHYPPLLPVPRKHRAETAMLEGFVAPPQKVRPQAADDNL